MINAMQQRHIIGKPLGKIEKIVTPEKLKVLRNKADNLKVYTEAPHRDEWERDACLKAISRLSDELALAIEVLIQEVKK